MKTTSWTSALIPACADRPQNDPIFALNAEAGMRKAAGESILNATLGALLNDNGTLAVLPCVPVAAARVPITQAAAYAPISGGSVFQEAVIGDLFGVSPRAASAVAVATAGASGALHHAIQNVLEPGQSLLVPDHYWGPYGVMASHARRGLETFNTFDAELRFDTAALGRALTDLVRRQGRALLILNFPCNNPTGYTLDGSEWDAVTDVVEQAAGHGPVSVLIDHAYARFGPPDSTPWERFAPRMLESATVFVAWTASKAFTLYGARVGALVALHPDPDERARLSAALNYSCRATWSNCNHQGILTVTSLLQDEELAARANAERAELIELLNGRVREFNRLAASAGLRFPRYEGGFFVSVLTPDARATAALMRDRGVYVVPLDGAVRVALCATAARDVPRLVDALAAGVVEARS